MPAIFKNGYNVSYKTSGVGFKVYISIPAYASSFVVRIRLMPAMKKIKPSMPNMTSDLISRVPPALFTNIIAA
jgi:hypothetical protein